MRVRCTSQSSIGNSPATVETTRNGIVRSETEVRVSGAVRQRGGFTLVELLIVIAIIGLLAALSAGAVGMARAKAAVARAKTDVNSMATGLENYFQDYNIYPCAGSNEEVEVETNQFPLMYELTCGEKPPQGKGGINSPYLELKIDQIAVFVEENDEGQMIYEQASKDLRLDPDTEKFVSDPWGSVYWYRENKSKRTREDYMIGRNKFDLWTPGPDGENEAMFGEPEGKCDDIGNW